MENYQFTQFMKYSRMKGEVTIGDRTINYTREPIKGDDRERGFGRPERRSLYLKIRSLLEKEDSSNITKMFEEMLAFHKRLS